MRKSKNKGYKWIAAMMTAVLLVGQCHVPVLAQEGTAPAESGISDENGAGAQEGADAGTDDDASKDGEDGGDQSGADNGGGNDSAEDDGAGNGGTEDGAGDAGSGDGSDNGGAGNDGEGESGAGDTGTGDAGENQGGEEGTPDKCICETACTEDAVNEDCPVCAADYANCAQNAGGEVNPSEGTGEEETVSENDLDGEAGIALMAADEGVEALAVGEEFTDDQGIKYKIVYGKLVKVIGHENRRVRNLTISATVDYEGSTYTVGSIDELAFSGFNASQLYLDLTSVEIQEGITSIGNAAFAGCENLTSIKLPDSLTSIEHMAFDGCKSLKDIVLPVNLRKIGYLAFRKCWSINSIKIPEGMKEIEQGVFAESGLQSIDIPRSVTTIGPIAFSSCINLKSIEIPNSVTSIERRAFEMSGLESIEIPDSVTRISEETFSHCENMTSVKIPNSVKDIETKAFQFCRRLGCIEIPNSIENIGSSAFAVCNNLSNVEIPNSVTCIRDHTFEGCNNLRSVKISNSITSIENEAFSGCLTLNTLQIVVPDQGITPPRVGVNVFNGTPVDRFIAFMAAEDGRILDVEEAAYIAAHKVFKEDNDGNSSDELWWGWEIGDIPELFHITYHLDGYTPTSDECQYTLGGRTLPVPEQSGYKFDGWYENVDYYGDKVSSIGSNEIGDKEYYGRWIDNATLTYYVTVKVQKDTNEWKNHNRTFALTKDNGTTFITNCDAVEAGTYVIYDVTGLNADEFQTKGVNTGVTVPVVDADVSATVDYYTASFYDIDAGGNEVEYGTDTDQRQQTVLKTVERVTRPATNPSKAGHTFDKWVTAPNGDVEFVFATTPVTAPTKIYAKWTKNTAPTYNVTINVKKDKNPWSGHGKTFALLGGGGSGFLEVPGQTGDSTYSLSQVPDGTYRIFDITGVPADSLYSRARDTGMDVRVSGADTQVDVTVNGADEEKDVHYYTATFYDGADAYKAGTPQEPQIVLQGRQVLKPADPGKADYDFAGWKTTDGGSTPYDFANAVTDTTRIFASWVEKTAEQLHITASAAEGGTISPTGDISVTKGGEQTFTITPNEGHKIKAVTVDGRDATAELKDTLARAQAGARYYTFTNVTEDHTIHAAFETDGGTPGGEDKPGGDDDPGGDDEPGGDDKPGGNDKPADGDRPDGGDTSGGGDDPVPDGGTGDIQTTAVIQTASPQTVTSTAGNTQTSGGAEQGAEKAAAPNEKEPKTGDPTPVEIYATVAMIAGLTYLLLYFMEEGRGMTEREKEVFVAAFIRWAKKGGRFRKCCAIAAIFCLLVYYHGIGKRAGNGRIDREGLRQAI